MLPLPSPPLLLRGRTYTFRGAIDIDSLTPLTPHTPLTPLTGIRENVEALFPGTRFSARFMEPPFPCPDHQFPPVFNHKISFSFPPLQVGSIYKLSVRRRQVVPLARLRRFLIPHLSNAYVRYTAAYLTNFTLAARPPAPICFHCETINQWPSPASSLEGNIDRPLASENPH